MKTHLLLGSALLLLVAPDIALAQDHARPAQGGGHGRPPVAKPAQQRPAPSRPGPSRPTPPRPGTGGPAIQPPRPAKPVRPERPKPPVKPGHGWQKPRPPHKPGIRPPNFRPIHRPGWQYPRGYSYRRWTIGLLLPHLFLSSRYYFDDYANYGFGPPPYGCRWVRYGPDLLLVDVRTGRIRDVIYGAFY
ncbi:RcnB family protein [Sphingomonas oryzagri]|uniref:RcnB family protein n=1 Tax=Sphingomonas oryzagri TaxID=3042314 RepID=A0ABT6N6S7_9SPHN|nr:RcnB family protein [Sphingomonas oryzagri]MDH7640793.1 RcnB family protein [Sphingomonas oryzagri]